MRFAVSETAGCPRVVKWHAALISAARKTAAQKAFPFMRATKTEAFYGV